MERPPGIEPGSVAWEATVMPLYDGRGNAIQPQAVELSGLPDNGSAGRLIDS